MSYATWSDVRGHSAQIGVLQRICASAQPAHAYLFEGPDGVGKQMVAWALAARIACEAPTADQAACGECRSCHSLQRGEHPDLKVLKKDGASIRIGQVRDALKPLRFEPVLGRAKVLIVDDAHLLREEAANALLKTLEEPPSRTHFILVTSRAQLLLSTIRSRSQVVRFAELDTQDVAAVLLAEDQPADLVAMAAPLAEGSVVRGRTLCDPDWLAAIDRLVRFVLGLGAGNPLRIGDAVAGLGGTLDGLSLQISPEQQPMVAAPTASISEAKALAQAEKKGRSAPKKLASKPESGTRLKGLDRVGLSWALDVTTTVLRDAMLVATGMDPDEVPLSRHAEGLLNMRDRTHAAAIAKAIDACLATEASLVLNPNPRLALEATWLEVDRAIRHA
ncbi:MAG: DNA polymerase III subunit delta' [Myxococcales bacterium]|nr:DNA polymerase III subunit delta' [Myxococcales bacterium]